MALSDEYRETEQEEEDGAPTGSPMAGRLLYSVSLILFCLLYQTIQLFAPRGLSDDVADILWGGGHLSPDAAADVFTKRKGAAMFSKQAESATKLVLLGPIDSGTHLMSWLLTENYRGNMDEACGVTHRGCRYLWKHSADVGGVYRVLNETLSGDFTSTVVVAMVKSPIALVVGWKRDPWDLSECVDRPWAEMGTHCTAHLCASKPADHVGRAAKKMPLMHFRSTMDVYNQYIKLYKSLKTGNLFKKVVIVPYEDLVLTPWIVLYQVASALGWNPASDIVMPNEDRKFKGASGRSQHQAIVRIQSRDFVEEARDGMPFLCRHLNKTLISDIEEGRWVTNHHLKDFVARSYSFDCDNYSMLH